jgi:hypothetical protein
MWAIAKLNASDRRSSVLPGLAVTTVSLIVAGLGFGNGLFVGVFWPAYLLLCAALAIGCYMFVRLIFTP